MPDGARTLVGRIREKLGWLTADRMEEARGRLAQADAAGVPSSSDAAPRDQDDSAAEAVDRAELEVREDYGDLAPEARPDRS
jgi:hypothetical protein